MFNLLKKRIKNEKGLTLVEVLAVVVILAIVAAIAIPAIGNMIENSRIKAIKADAVNVISAAQLYYTDGGADGFNGEPGKGAEYIENLGSIELTDLSVTREGEISATGTKGNVTIKFTKAKVQDINPDSTDGKEGVVDITAN